MNRILRCLLLTSFWIVSIKAEQEIIPCALLDLAGHEAIVYDPFLGLLRASGFDVSYVGLDAFVDERAIQERLATQTKGIFLVVNADLLANMTTSPIGKKLADTLNRVSQVPDFFVCLLLPNFSNVRHNVALLPALRDIFAPLGIDTDPIVLDHLVRQSKKSIQVRPLTAAAIDFFLKHPINTRPLSYHTTLSLPHEGLPLSSAILRAAHDHPALSLTFLPAYAKRFASKKIRQTLPYFLYTYSPLKKLHILVGHEMLASGFGITEQFHIRPIRTALAQEMLDLVGLGVAQFHSLITKANPAKKNFHKIVKETSKPDFSSVVNSFGKKNDDALVHPLRKIAWMEIALFEPLSPQEAKKQEAHDRLKRQATLINYLLQSKIEGLWITLNPHQYWSPIARKKDRENIFLASVSNFTKQLAAACKRAKKPLPTLLVGFEITNNVYLPNLPKMCAVDAFGNEFADIPAPLSEQFWRDEIIKPLEVLAERWKNPRLSNGILLKGVVLDLEMYCRKRIGSFTPSCGFDKDAITSFDQALISTGFTVHGVVKKLMDSSRYGSFLKDRTDKAKQLGMMLRSAFKRIVGKDAYIVCYAQNLMIDWFYKGLYQGLGTHQDPLMLLTFNAEFMRHRPWLENQAIFANHGCVVLLSKITSSRHFGYVNNVLQNHQNVWINRVSRLVEDYEPKSWIGIEQTPLNEQGKLRFVRHLATV
ncbi:hypothetical protein FJ364_04130 [Candidatus Dependentiae bacterium]|nr:hypothetical protein [Candidatus Dependentiae bacterium]